MSDKLDIVVSLKDRFSKGMKTVGTSLGGVTKGVDKLKNAMFGLKAAVVGIAAVFAGKQLIDIANEQAKAVAGMETALRSMGRYTKEFSQNMQDIASDIQSFTNYGDEAVLVGQKFLATYANITDDLLPRVSLAMVDLAALMGGDMQRAANMMGKASMGMVGQLSLAGISIGKTTFATKGFVGVLGEMENQTRGQARAQRIATGSMTAMGNSFADVKEKAGEFLKVAMEPAFSVLLERFDSLNTSIATLKTEGRLDEWANNLSKKVIANLEFMVMGTLSVYEVFAPIMANFKGLFTGIWDWFTGLPTWVQTSGIILAIMGGKKLKYTLAALAFADKSIRDIYEEFKLLRFESDESATNVENLNTLLEALIIRKKQLEEGKGWRLFDNPERQAEDLKLVNAEIEDTKKLLESAKDVEIIDKDAEVDKISAMRASLVSLFEDIEKKRIELATKLEEPFELGQPKGGKAEKEEEGKPSTAMSQAAKDLLSLEVLYQRGEEELIFYLERRKALVLQTLDGEIKKLEEAAKAETDSSKRLAVEDAIFVKKQEYALREVELQKKIAQAYGDSANRKLEVENAMADLRSRTGVDVDDLQAAELAEMDERHRLEYESFKTMLDDKLAAEMGYLDESAALKDVEAEQQKERDKLQVQHYSEVWEKKLDLAGTAASNLVGIFEDLYELSEDRNKSAFELMKKAAIAEAIINTAKAVSGALGTPPYGLGAIATAALIAIRGGIEIAKIKAQEMAEGGLVGGSSPTTKADNIPIKGTAGEFMQPVSAVKHLGLRVMEGIRQNVFPKELFDGFKLPAFARTPSGSGYAEGGVVSGGSSNFSVSVPVNINEGRAAGIAGMLQDEVEETVIRVMERELR